MHSKEVMRRGQPRFPILFTSADVIRLPLIAEEEGWTFGYVNSELADGTTERFETVQDLLAVDTDHWAKVNDLTFRFDHREFQGNAFLSFKPAHNVLYPGVHYSVRANNTGTVLAFDNRLNLFCQGLRLWYGPLSRAGFWGLIYILASIINLLFYWLVKNPSFRPALMPFMPAEIAITLIYFVSGAMWMGLSKVLFPGLVLSIGQGEAKIKHHAHVRGQLLKRAWELFLVAIGALLGMWLTHRK